MKKLFGLLAIIGLLFFTSCKKEDVNPTPKSVTELNGNWDVLEKGTISISSQGDTTVANYEWDGLNALEVANVTSADYESVGAIVTVNNVNYSLDEWEMSSANDTTYSRYIWVQNPNASDGDNYYYVLGKRLN